ncbi:uncharacterized protein LOC116209098 [Punica granatum]|uniref:Uncharacterized protein LOC116189740 n=1 Tax=Punica granatum TaxID=22663 RepID=A0A6P8C2V7_PUNGR|nr:uncharacterized protein LOC116189740 [Punica granatum]XP_031375698.1 uncharacterized protein LOC116190179 [Punica granatum]XP_031398516.1 uncharacterized protein LOC116209098 [Punica granatum]
MAASVATSSKAVVARVGASLSHTIVSRSEEREKEERGCDGPILNTTGLIKVFSNLCDQTLIGLGRFHSKKGERDNFWGNGAQRRPPGPPLSPSSNLHLTLISKLSFLQCPEDCSPPLPRFLPSASIVNPNSIILSDFSESRRGFDDDLLKLKLSKKRTSFESPSPPFSFVSGIMTSENNLEVNLESSEREKHMATINQDDDVLELDVDDIQDTATGMLLIVMALNI